MKLLAKLSQREQAWVWAVFVLALIVRFRYLLLIEHNVDHAYYVGQALRTLDEGYLPVIGQATSLQFPNSAFLGYLYVPLMALTRHVLSVYVFVIALNSLGAAFIFKSARLIGLPFISAIAASVIYAVNPWLIEYTRSTWSYSIMPFLLTLLFYSVLLIISKTGRQQTTAVVVGAIAATLITLVTLTGYLILPTLLVCGWALRQRLPWHKIALASSIFLVPTAIFGGALLVNWSEMSGRASSFLAASESAYLRSEPIQHAMRLVTGADYELQRGIAAPVRDAHLRTILTGALHAVFILGLIMGVLWLLRRSPYRQLVLIWAVTPVAILSYNSALIHPFYLMLTIPATILIAGAGVAYVGTNRWAATIVVVILGSWSIVSLTNSARYYQETAATPGQHGLTALPLGELLRIGGSIKTVRADELVQVGVESWILHSAAGFTFPTTHQLDNQRRVAVPPDGLLIIRMADERPDHPLLPEETVWQHWLVDGTALQISRITPHLPDDAVRAQHESNGDLALAGYRLSDTPDALVLDVFWRIQQRPDDLTALYSLAVHVFRDNERVAIADGPPVETRLWQPGMLIAQRATVLITQPGIYTLKVGLYDGSRDARPAIAGQEADGMVPIPEPLFLPSAQNG